MKNAISLYNISKVYRVPSLMPWKPARKTEALRDVSFNCARGNITCLLGPNGAGKTTVVKILSGLVRPDGGDAELLEVSLAETGFHFQSKIGLLTSNDRSFYWRLTGRQNMDFFAALHGLKGNLKRQRISEVLFEVGLNAEADKPFRLYSSGMKQKLLLCRALLGMPEILLLDEPTTHLDPAARANMHKFIREILINKRGATVLLCTNDLSEAQELADHLVFLNNGIVITEGSLSLLRSGLQSYKTLVLEFERLPKPGWHKNFDILPYEKDNSILEINIADTEIIPDIIQAAVSSGGRLLSCRQKEPTLSEIFTKMTQE